MVLTLKRDETEVPVLIDERDLTPNYNWTPLMDIMLKRLEELQQRDYASR